MASVTGVCTAHGNMVGGMTGAQIKEAMAKATNYAPGMMDGSDQMQHKADKHNEAAQLLQQACGMLANSWKGQAAEAARAHLEAMRKVHEQASQNNVAAAQIAYSSEGQDHTETHRSMNDIGDKPEQLSGFDNAVGHIFHKLGTHDQDDLNKDWQGKSDQNVQKYTEYASRQSNTMQPLSNTFPAIKEPSSDITPDSHDSGSIGGTHQSSASSGSPSGSNSGPGVGASSVGSGSAGSSGVGGSGAGGAASGGGATPGGGSLGAVGGGVGGGSNAGSHTFRPAASGSASGSIKGSKPSTFNPSSIKPIGGSSFSPSSSSSKVKDGAFDPSTYGGTSAAGVDSPSPGSAGIGGGGFAPGGSSNQNSAGGGAAAGAGMMPPPMMGGAGMGAGAGEQVRSGGGFGPKGSMGAGSGMAERGFGPTGSGSGASTPAAGGRGAGGMGPMGGAGKGKGGDDDQEHEDNYYMKSEMDVDLAVEDEYGEKVVDPSTGMLVPPEVIGE